MQCSNIFEGELVEVIEGYSFSQFVLLFYTVLILQIFNAIQQILMPCNLYLPARLLLYIMLPVSLCL